MPYFYSPFGIVGLLVFILDIVAIFSVMAGRSAVERKIIWTLVILALPVLGMALYFLFGRDRTDAQLRA